MVNVTEKVQEETKRNGKMENLMHDAVILVKKILDMKKNTSKKHHYLPRYYLKGFTNSKNSFFVYDKQEDKIFVTSPDAFFFENNLNTVTFPKGNTSDFLEGIYTYIENRSWNSLDT